MPHEELSIRTAEGECPVHVQTPDGEGPWPAVIVYMDAFGVRPALEGMAARLASAGYVALLPDLFYRAGTDKKIPAPKDAFASGNVREVIGPFMATTGNDKAAEDTRYFLDYLASRGDVTGKVGTVGFCMGGGMALAAAGTYPDRVAAAASFHGGNLATDAPTSPHRLAPKIEAEVYVAGADNDHSYPPEMAERLEKALTEAGVRYKAEIYEGCAHGWMKPDFPVYDEANAERGWRAMLALFERNLP